MDAGYGLRLAQLAGFDDDLLYEADAVSSQLRAHKAKYAENDEAFQQAIDFRKKLIRVRTAIF